MEGNFDIKPRVPKPKPEFIVENTAPIDYSKYRFFGTSVLLGIPTEAHTSGVITYSKLNLGVWFPVVAVGKDVNQDYIKPTDKVLINPDLPVNQIPVLTLEGRKHLRVEWHELFIVCDENVETSPVNYTDEDGMEGRS